MLISSLFPSWPGAIARAPLTVPGDYPTIQAAIDAAQSGDLILVSPGTYNQSLRIEGKSITIASEFHTTGNGAFVDATIIDGGIVVDGDSAGTTIIGFTIQNGEDGIRPSAAVVVSHNRIRWNSDGIDFEGGVGSLVEYNVVEENGDDGIDLDQSTGAEIRYNTITNNNSDGLEMRIHDYTGSSTLNIVISDNMIVGNGDDGLQIIEALGAGGTTNRLFLIEKNLIAGNGAAGLGFLDNGETNQDFRAAKVPDPVHFFNNTVVANDHGVSGSGTDLVVVNNLFVGHTNLALKKVDAGSIAAYNLFWDNGTDFLGDSNVDLATSVFGDPLLDGDFTLLAGSPAIDAGTSQYTHDGELILDIPSTEFWGSAPDLGAFESDIDVPPNGPPAGVDDGYDAAEDTLLVVAAPGVLSNDTDADGDSLNVSASDDLSVEGGTVVMLGDGSFTYDPAADYSGIDSFGYTVSDGALTDTATVTITVAGVPDPPVGVDDDYDTTENTLLVVAAPGVLVNDTDPDEDSLTVSASDVVSVEGGTVVMLGDGSFTYDPPAGFNEIDTFEYTVSDGALTDTATVTVTVADVPHAPVAVDDPYDGVEDTLLVVAAPGVLFNDTDPDGDSLTVSAADALSAEGGTVVMLGDGSFTYDPPADFNGTDTFEYTVSDGALTDTATVTITVAGVPDPPVGVDDDYDTTEDTQLAVIAAAGVLFNDTDPDGDTLMVSASDVVSVEGGTVVVAADGSFTYDPPVDFNGTDTFEYTVSDGALTDTATVTITVSSPQSGGGGGGGFAPPPEETCPEVLPATGFVDLVGYSAETIDAITCLMAYEISLGTSSTTFAPDFAVTRRQMALFLIRQIEVHGMNVPSAGDQGFTDIFALPQATQDAINQLAGLGITKGTTDTSFDPDDVVTRWQMALFLARVADLVEIPMSDSPVNRFLDTGDYSRETQTAINQLAEAGIAKGTGPTTFDPAGEVLRWHMALFLTRCLTADGITFP